MALIDNKRHQNQIFSLVAQASDCLQTNPQEAQQHLEKLKNTLPTITDSLERTKRELEERQRKLESEGEAIARDINSLEREQDSLRDTVNSLVASKAGLESDLEYANRDLERAESDKRRAESKKDDAIIGTVAGGVGAVVLGIFFPPSLALTVPAVATAGTISIVEADKAVDRCKSRVSSVRGSIADTERRINTANNDIGNNQRRIAEQGRRKQQLHEELGQVKNSSGFMREAEYYFGGLKVAVEGGQNPTELLHKYAKKANQEERYVILNSKGVKIKAQSFATVWEKVQDMLKNDPDGFMNISFVEVPYLK